MDLGLSGKTAIVCASSQGLGFACAQELARAGCRLVINGRDADAVEQAAAKLRQDAGVEVIAIAGDIARAVGASL